MSRRTAQERRVCIWKKAGFTSEEIAEYRGGTAAAVHTLLSRARQKIRRLLAGEPGDARRDEFGNLPDDSDKTSAERGGTDVENDDGD